MYIYIHMCVCFPYIFKTFLEPPNEAACCLDPSTVGCLSCGRASLPRGSQSKCQAKAQVQQGATKLLGTLGCVVQLCDWGWSSYKTQHVKLRNVDHSSSDTSGPHSSQLLCGRFVADRPWGLIWFRKAQLLQNDNWLGFISVFLVLICFMFQIAGPSFFCNANQFRAQLRRSSNGDIRRFHSATVGSSFASGVQQIGSSGGGEGLSPGESSKKNLDGHWMDMFFHIFSKSLFYGDLFVSDIYTCLRSWTNWCDMMWPLCIKRPQPVCSDSVTVSSYAVWNDSFYHSSISRGYIFGAHIALLSQIIFIFADANAGALHWRGQIDLIWLCWIYRRADRQTARQIDW